MIPRLKPYTNMDEIIALLSPMQNAVGKFESEFARTFRTKFAIAFPYGRSALWAFFKAMGIKNSEVVQPGYTCSVVGHATALSGNVPRFVDINLDDYNMDLDLFERAITKQTRAVIPTHLFGYPMDIDRVNEIVKEAEKRHGHRIYIIQDCAHSFEAKWQGKSVINAGDGAIFGLGISKQITSIFGGMFTTNDEEIASKLRIWRDMHFIEKTLHEKFRRAVYLSAATIAFNDFIYGLTFWLQENTSLLKDLTDAYHLDQKIHFPPDYMHLLSALEARVGTRQLIKYPQIKSKRQDIALFYFDNLKAHSNWVIPPRTEGATYSHFVIRVPDREKTMARVARNGVQLGRLIEYSMPHLGAYKKYAGENLFPNSLLCSQSMINLPIYPGLRIRTLDLVINCINELGGI